MKLLFDVCRCLGGGDEKHCAKRDICERYRERNNLGPRTPISDGLCQFLEVPGQYPFYIEHIAENAE